MTKGTSYT